MGKKDKTKKEKTVVAREAVEVVESSKSTLLESFGGSLCSRQLAFSNNNKKIFCASGTNIKVVSVNSGRTVATLTGHTAEVTSVVSHPTNEFQILSSSLDGTVRVWDFNDGSMLKKIEVQFPVASMVIPSSKSSYVYLCVYSTPALRDDQVEDSEEKRKYRVVKCVLKTGKCKRLFKCKGAAAMSTNSSGSVLAAVVGPKLVVWQSPDSVSKYVHKREMKTCSVHPTEALIATGDSRGEIILWHNAFQVGDTRQQPQETEVLTTSMHWHAHEVGALAFSPTGRYLVSGGEEAVVVIWQLDSQQRQFLPRQGAAIKHITVSENGEKYGVCCADNTIRVLNATTLDVERKITGLKLCVDNAIKRDRDVGLVIQPKSGLLVVNGGPGILQFFNPHSDCHVSEIDVVPRNVVSRSQQRALVVTRVEHVCFTASGHDMVTLDRRADGETSETLQMKFWHYDTESHSFVINTRVDMPHKAIVTALAAHPTQEVVVSVSHDSRFRTWVRVENTKTSKSANKQPNLSWVCRSVGFHMDQPLNAATFSHDGTLLAVASAQTVSLWDPETNYLHRTLTSLPPTDHIRFLAFLPASTYLVVASSAQLMLWDLLSFSIRWTFKASVAALSVHPSLPSFTVSLPSDDGSGHLLVFNGSSPLPTHAWRLDQAPSALTHVSTASTSSSNNNTNTDGGEDDMVVDAGSGGGGGGAASESSYNLVVLSDSCELSLLRVDGGTRASQTAVSEEQEQPGAYEQLFGAARTTTSTASATTATQSTGRPESRAWHDLLSGPSHVAPPATLLAEAFFSNILPATSAPATTTSADTATGGDPMLEEPTHAPTPATAKPLQPTTYHDQHLYQLDASYTTTLQHCFAPPATTPAPQPPATPSRTAPTTKSHSKKALASPAKASTPAKPSASSSSTKTMARQAAAGEASVTETPPAHTSRNTSKSTNKKETPSMNGINTNGESHDSNSEDNANNDSDNEDDGNDGTEEGAAKPKPRSAKKRRSSRLSQ